MLAKESTYQSLVLLWCTLAWYDII